MEIQKKILFIILLLISLPDLSFSMDRDIFAVEDKHTSGMIVTPKNIEDIEEDDGVVGIEESPKNIEVSIDSEKTTSAVEGEKFFLNRKLSVIIEDDAESIGEIEIPENRGIFGLEEEYFQITPPFIMRHIDMVN